MKTYRTFIDIKGKSKEDALRRLELTLETEGVLGTSMTGNGNLFRVQEDPLSDEEEVTVMEVTRWILEDYFSGRPGFRYVGLIDNLDLSDKELKKLKSKIEKVMNR